MMKKILVTSAGGAPSANFIRSLRAAQEEFHIVGVDANKYTIQRSEADKNYLVPYAKDPDYLPVLLQIIEAEEVEFLHCQMNGEMLTVSAIRDQIGVKTLLPSRHAIEVLEDKYKSYLCWQKAGLPVPETLMLNDEQDLVEAFDRFGPRIWVRATQGAAGKGSLPTDDFDTAVRWINFMNGWGHFTAAECLEPQTITWQSIWKDGELVVAQGRKRLYWEFADRAPSGVTGVTGTGVTINDPSLDELAIGSVLAVEEQPNGIYGVDMTYDANGNPHLTEINVGRFFTTHYFFTAAGLNMPYIYVKLAYGEDPPLPARKLNPLEPGLAWVRGMDCHPVLTTVEKIDQDEQAFKNRLAMLKK
ncbi:MAG: carboxylate--amine ligase [Desulfuromonadales bacterium]